MWEVAGGAATNCRPLLTTFSEDDDSDLSWVNCFFRNTSFVKTSCLWTCSVRSPRSYPSFIYVSLLLRSYARIPVQHPGPFGLRTGWMCWDHSAVVSLVSWRHIPPDVGDTLCCRSEMSRIMFGNPAGKCNDCRALFILPKFHQFFESFIRGF